MRDLNDFVFIDCETGGLNPFTDPLLEISYAVGNAKPTTLYVNWDDWSSPDCRHLESIFTASDNVALEVNRYLDRFAADHSGDWYAVPDGMGEFNLDISPSYYGRSYYAYLKAPVAATDEEWDAFAKAIHGKTWVGANPAFDVAFLQHHFNPEPLTNHHRLFDIEAYHAGLKGDDRISGLSGIYEECRKQFPYITKNDHTSYNDVLMTRQVWMILTGRLGDLETQIEIDTH